MYLKELWKKINVEKESPNVEKEDVILNPSFLILMMKFQIKKRIS